MATEPLPVRCFDSFADVRADACGLLDGDAQPSPFDRLDWFEMLHGAAFAGQKPTILAVRQGEARAWLFLTGKAGKAMSGIANWYSFSFRPQFAHADDTNSRLALITALAHALRGNTPRLSFHPVVDEEGSDSGLIEQAFAAAGWWVVPRVMARKRLLRLEPGTSFEGYWSARPGLLRSTYKRKSRRHPAEIKVTGALDDGSWEALERIFRASWKPTGDDFAFLRRFAEAESKAGRLRLGLASIDGEPAAVELWTVEQGRAYIHKLAFDERFADASPGTQLSYAMFRQAIDVDRVSVLDFGTGDNDYKAAWMPNSSPVRQIDAFDMTRPAAWRHAAGTWLSALSQPGKVDGPSHGKSGAGRRAALEAVEANRGRAQAD